MSSRTNNRYVPEEVLQLLLASLMLRWTRRIPTLKTVKAQGMAPPKTKCLAKHPHPLVGGLEVCLDGHPLFQGQI
jgi:hypothetical protein